MLHRIGTALCSAALFAAAGTATAARPMITDDARIVDPKACQVESWVRFERGERAAWAVPGCNPTGNLELSAGGAYGDGDAGRGVRATLLQAKTLVRPLSPDGVGWGVAVGAARDRGAGGSSGLGDPYLYLPVSAAFRGEDVVVHLNVGATRDRAAGRTEATWGLGTEWRLAGRTQLVAEAFGQGSGRPHLHAGLRAWVVPDRVQVDATVGERIGGGRDARWVSIGLRLLSPPFLP